MTCYSYLSNSSLLLTNIEFVHTITSSLTYSYNSIAWICEFPEDLQLKIYRRASALGTETLLIQNTDYTVNTTTKNIVLASALTVGHQLVIRRKTPTDRMLYNFIDGAKLTATQLNESFNQLLFAIQENVFTGSTTNFFYTISTGVPAWVSGTTYAINSIVSHTAEGATALYKRLTTGAGTTAPNIDTGNWSVINPSSSGFIIIGGPSVVQFDLSNLSVGKTLIWDGSKFVCASFTGTLASLSDVSISSPVSGNILRYNGSAWANAAPSVDITLANPVFTGRTFYNSSLSGSYTNGGSSISAPGSGLLNEFKNSSNQWVLLDPVTSYRILQKTIPSSNIFSASTPEDFFSGVNTTLAGFQANITNPVKVKFQWDLGLERRDILDYGTGQYLSDTPTTFWDNPKELYSASGYSTTAGSPLWRYGVQETNSSGNIHRSSPYFYQVLTSGGSAVSYVSKIKGYGIKSFYLSIPESHTSALLDLPAMASSSTYFTSPGTLTLSDLTTQLNTIGNENAATHRDYYLLGLRDLAFAGARTNPGDVSTVRNRDAVTRFNKSLLISAVYTGLENITFKRFEDSSDSGSDCLWKIPKQIIYYNKAALALANNDLFSLNTSGSFATNTVRFTGYSEFISSVPSNSTNITSGTTGQYFKADELWNDWCATWSTGTAAQRFNEADIDWLVQGVTQTSPTNLNLYRLYGKAPPFAVYNGTNLSGTIGGNFFPWHFRPNDIRVGSSTTGLTGTHLLNIDANCLFSTAHNFIPDPIDEYVFRIVTKKSLLPYFSDASYTHLKSAIILEYGFTDHNFNGKTTVLTTKGDIFKQGLLRPGPSRSLSRLDKSKVRVFVKHEGIERTNTSDDRYVITLAIQVPRLKSIGYSKIFRQWNGLSTYPQRDSVTTDSEIDSGPWNFSDIDIEHHTFSGALAANESFNTNGTDSYLVLPASSDTDSTEIVNGYGSTPCIMTDSQFISGRNECAVKFTRMGIPSNLWIRLSVLNTDGSTDIITSGGFDTSTNE